MDGTWTRESNLTMTMHERASTGTGDRMDRARRDSTKGSGVESAILGDGTQEQAEEIRKRIYSYQKEQMNDTRRLWRGEYEYTTLNAHAFINPKVVTHAQWQKSGFAQGPDHLFRISTYIFPTHSRASSSCHDQLWTIYETKTKRASSAINYGRIP